VGVKLLDCLCGYSAVDHRPRDRALGKAATCNAAGITSQGVLVRPTRNAHTSLTRRKALPADDMGGWVDCSHLNALALLDRTAVQGTATAATERDFSAYSLGHKRVRRNTTCEFTTNDYCGA